ncbi:MAG: type 1 glutamine amidotransferase [Halobacteriaceae archaeon]
MSRLHVALLDASHGSEHTPRNFRREVDADLSEFDVTAEELPPDYRYDAAIVTGSRASVYWTEDWIAGLKSWVDGAVEREVPLLGVCYGHQLLADVLGGEVGAMDEYEIGYREVEHDGGRLFEGIDETFTAFTTHSDEVTTTPPGAEVLAENDRSIHAFRKGPVFGVQFHPEYDPETAESVTRGKGELADERMESVLDGITEENYRAACEAKTVFENFCDFARERTAPEAAAD